MNFRFQAGGKVYTISLEQHAGVYQATVDGEPFQVEVLDAQPGQLSLLFEGRPLILYWAEVPGRKWFSLDGCTFQVEKPDLRAARQSLEGTTEASIRAPMPAQVISVHVSPEEHVEKGQTLLTLEAMKMEIRLQAPYAGVIKRLPVGEGESVERDQVLVELEKTEEP